MWHGPSVVAVSIGILLFAVPSTRAQAKMKPIDLRCEFKTQPLGIDSPRPRLSWIFENVAGQRNVRQAGYRILVASSRTNLKNNLGDLWDSGAVRSDQQNNIPYAGNPLAQGQTCYWKVGVWTESGQPTWSPIANWEMGIPVTSDWIGKWISDGKSNPTQVEDFYKDDPAPIFRKRFANDKPIAKARLFITGLGYYEATINGMKVGDQVLEPGWTKFDKRTFYSVYDVTKLIASGDNCLGVMLGNGWYNPLPLKLFGSFNLRDQLTVGRPKFIAQLKIDYRDGTSQIIVTDKNWKVSAGPVIRNNIYLGEVYDARRVQPGWDKPGFDDSMWGPVTLAGDQEGNLVSQPQPPIRVTKTWQAVKLTQPKQGTFIYDCGTNFAGWVSLKFNLPRGTKVVIRYGELLNKDGTLNPMTSVAGQIKGSRNGVSIGGPGAPNIAWQSDTFIASGKPETYTPKFTFHAGRYVEITGIEKPLSLNDVSAMRLNSDVEQAGSFECSNPMLNEIQKMCDRTFKSNIFSVQSDCPHRERLGYGGDIVATSEAFMMNYNMAGFYSKAVKDWSDSALPNGMFTDTAPFMGIQYCGLIWAMAHPLLVEQLHQYYGDRLISEEEYSAAKRWMDLVEAQYPTGIVTDGLSDHEALTPTPAPEYVTPMYYQCAKLLAAQAKRLQKREDQIQFEALATKIQTAFVSNYIDSESGKVGPGTQTCQAMAIYTGIAPTSIHPKILDFLVKDIETHKRHLTTGILGTKFVLQVLSEQGRADLAYSIATQPDFPGWGWMLQNGATTLWEHWELSDNTYSHNHPMFGSISQWMMNWLGGIQPASEAVGFDQVEIRPQTPVGLDWVKSSYNSVRGKFTSNWKRTKDGIEYEFEIAPNTRASIRLPGSPADEIFEGGKPFSEASRRHNGSTEINLGSGKYLFLVRTSTRP